MKYALLAMGLLIAADRPQDDARKLEGTWVMVRGWTEGKVLPPDVVKNAQLVIEGNHHRAQVGDMLFVGTHELDPTKTPRAIDTKDTEGPFAGKVAFGIYRLDGDEFAVCFARPGDNRPTGFTTTGGTGFIYHVWKRARK